MKASKIIGIVSVCTAAVLLSVKGYGMIKERQRYNEAVKAAQDHLQSKYGFSSDMSDDTQYPVRQKSLKDKNIYEFSSEHNGKSFSVFVNLDDESNIRCKDSYQLDEMYNEIKGRLEAEFPDSYIANCWLGDNDEWQTGHHLYGAFYDLYDGSNLDEIMKNSGLGQIEMCVTDTSLEGSDIYSKLEELNITYCFTAFDTKEHLEEFENLNGKGKKVIFDYTDYADYEYAAPYITEHIDNINGEKVSRSFCVERADEFMYTYASKNSPSDFPASEYIKSPSVIETKYFTSHFKYNGSEYKEAYDEREYVDTPLTKAWQFHNGFDDLLLYFPLDKLNGHDIEDLGCAWHSNGGFANDRNIEKLVVFGDYAVARLEMNSLEVMLVDIKGKGEYIPSWAKQK